MRGCSSNTFWVYKVIPSKFEVMGGVELFLVGDASGGFSVSFMLKQCVRLYELNLSFNY